MRERNYTPTVILSGPRHHPDPVARVASFVGRVLPLRAVFLIHGYNTRADAADEHYETFEYMLGEASEHKLEGAAVRVLWPGYQGDRIAPSAYFAESAQLALRSVNVFVDFVMERLDELGPAPHVVLVAHSLGCLLAARAASRLAQAGEGMLRVTLILMAAAIPVSADYAALGELEGCAVLYSPADTILRKYYPLGQWKIDGSWSEAVGLHGRPEDGVWPVREPMEGYEHGDYWGSFRAATKVCELLAVKTPRSLPESDLPSAAALQERDIPWRENGG
jgi:pimeloyl-ACP methyl ester carboxylesterase